MCTSSSDSSKKLWQFFFQCLTIWQKWANLKESFSSQSTKLSLAFNSKHSLGVVSPRGQFEWKAHLAGRCCSHTHCLACALTPSTFKCLVTLAHPSALWWQRVSKTAFFAFLLSSRHYPRCPGHLGHHSTVAFTVQLPLDFRCSYSHQLKDVEVFFFFSLEFALRSAPDAPKRQLDSTQTSRCASSSVISTKAVWKIHSLRFMGAVKHTCARTKHKHTPATPFVPTSCSEPHSSAYCNHSSRGMADISGVCVRARLPVST